MSSYWSISYPPLTLLSLLSLSCPFFWLQSHKWHEGSTARLLPGMPLNTRHSPAHWCQPHIFMLCSWQSEWPWQLRTTGSSSLIHVLTGQIAYWELYVHSRKPQQFCSFSPTVSIESLMDSHKHLLNLLFPGAFLVSVVTIINPAVTLLIKTALDWIVQARQRKRKALDAIQFPKVFLTLYP